VKDTETCLCGDRALDLDDVELVQMLLMEERTTINSTYGLHYAAMYCDPKIMADLLKLEIADTNVRNQRGFTVLHVAALRREPQTIGALLAKGAHVRDVTPDGRTALQISRRLGKKTDGDVDDEYNKDRLSIDILEQAGKKFACSKPTADVLSVTLSSEKELHESLSYLENRGSLEPSVTSLIDFCAKVGVWSAAAGMQNSTFLATSLAMNKGCYLIRWCSLYSFVGTVTIPTTVEDCFGHLTTGIHP
jgi:hypothetical protein